MLRTQSTLRVRLRLRVPPLLRNAARVAVLAPGLEQDVALLGAVRRRRREAAGHGGEAPLLDVGLDEDEAGLAKVDVDDAGAVGADGGEEVLRLDTVNDVLQFLTVAGEENGARPRAVADANDVALDVLRCVGRRVEGLVAPALARRQICGGVFVEA